MKRASQNYDTHFALIRLEDVGPGGDYQTLDDLGKLRAVFEYLHEEKVPFQVGVISRWKTLDDKGVWTENGIDDETPTETTKALISLLQNAQKNGSILGIHGYTHQFGEQKSEEDNQNSGIGFEFHVAGTPESSTTSYAQERITKGLNAFEKAGLRSGFWETPHYQDTLAQEEVFRSFIGILYQADPLNSEFQQVKIYETNNTATNETLGSIYVPTPLGYITDQKSVDAVFELLPKFTGLVSLFFHPFLEFPFLEPLRNEQGHVLFRENLPVYQYKQEQRSLLHQLVEKIRTLGFHWASLGELIPFSPAHRVTVAAEIKPSVLLFGDVNGDGIKEMIYSQGSHVFVIKGNFKPPRNRHQNSADVWLERTFSSSEQMLLYDVNHDGKADLVIYEGLTGKLWVFNSDGRRFLPSNLLGILPPNLDSIRFFLQKGRQIALLAKTRNQFVLFKKMGPAFKQVDLHVSISSQDPFVNADLTGDGNDDLIVYSQKKKKLFIFPSRNHRLLKGYCFQFTPHHPTFRLLACDVNQDGKRDLLFVYPHDGLWQKLRIENDYKLGFWSVPYGPWARGEDRVSYCVDIDGDGQSDLASYNQRQQAIDFSLAFRQSNRVLSTSMIERLPRTL